MKPQKTIFTDINALIKRLGSQKAAADYLGIKGSYLCDLLHQRRPISENVAAKLGYKWVLMRVN